VSSANDETDLPGSLSHTIASSDLKSLGKDLMEVGIDSVLKDGLLKDLPFISAIVGLWKAGVSVKDALFFKKLIAFLTDLSNIPQDKRAEMMASLNDADTVESTGEKLLALLDRMESPSKATLLGKSFRLLAEGTISVEEFWRVSFVLDRVPLGDIKALRDWKQVELNCVEHVRKHLYLAAGLGWFVLNASSTGFQWQQRLCTVFSDHLLA
jgi:hypothetical protein